MLCALEDKEVRCVEEKHSLAAGVKHPKDNKTFFLLCLILPLFFYHFLVSFKPSLSLPFPLRCFFCKPVCGCSHVCVCVKRMEGLVFWFGLSAK